MSGRPRSPRLMALCKSPPVTRSTSPGGLASVDGRTRRRRDHPGAHPNPRPVAHRCRQKAVPRSIRPATSRYSCLKSSRIPITNVRIASRPIASGDATVAAAKLDPFLHRAAYVGISGRSYPVAVTPDLIQHVAQGGDLASPDSHDLNRQAATNTCPICPKPFVATRRQANDRR
jgi:hypothetical protein